jgi:histidinol-phosphate aminotransferase
MEKKLVRISSAVLDIAPKENGNGGLPVEKKTRAGLKLDSNENTLGPSPRVRAALEDLIYTEPMHFHDGDNDDDLKNMLSEYVGLDSDSIRCFAGKINALEHISKTYLEQGTEIVINAPKDDNVTTIALSLGAIVTEVVHDNPFEFNIEALINHIGPKTRVIYIANPDEHTGASFSEAEIVFLLAYAERMMVVVDEEYFEFCGHSVSDLINRFPNLIVIRSFAKAFGLANIKAAYILSDPDNLGYVDRLTCDPDLDSFSRKAVLAVLDDLGYTRKYVSLIEQSKKLLLQNLPEIGYQFRMTTANFFVLKVNDSGMAARLLEDAGIAVKDFSDIRALDGFVRISIGTPEQTDLLLTSLGRIAEKIATGFNRNRLVLHQNRLARNIGNSVAIGK